MCHLLWGMCWSLRRLEMLVCAHGWHLGQLLVLWLLWTARMYHVAALAELLKVFLEA